MRPGDEYRVTMAIPRCVRPPIQRYASRQAAALEDLARTTEPGSADGSRVSDRSKGRASPVRASEARVEKEERAHAAPIAAARNSARFSRRRWRPRPDVLLDRVVKS